MDADIPVLVRGIGTGVALTVLVQTTFERLTARLGLEPKTASALSICATTFACAALHIHYFGNQPFGNMITTPVLLVLLVLCFFFAVVLPTSTVNSEIVAPAPPSVRSSLATGKVNAYIKASFNWAVRTSMVAMLVAVLRSGSQT
jgi:hypothetical protein